MNAFLGLFTSLALLPGAALGQQATSLMVNGGFENGDGVTPAGWSLSLWPGSEPAGACLFRSGEQVRSGDWALKIDTGPVVGQSLSLIFNGAVSDSAANLRGERLVLSGFVYVQPGTALRPIHMRLRTFGPDEQGQNAFLGDILDTTVFGAPGVWTEFRASGRVPDKEIRGIDLHCGVGADVVPTVQYLDDLRLEVPAPPPIALRPLRASLWRDEGVVPVWVEVAPGAAHAGPVSLALVSAEGEQVASWERALTTNLMGLRLPERLLPEGRYTLRARVGGDDGNPPTAVEATLELHESPWEGAPTEQSSPPAAVDALTQPGFEVMGTMAPTDAEDAIPEEVEPLSEDLPLQAWRERGYVVFSRHYLEVPSRLGRPRPGEIGPVRLFACPGEYEPATVSVWALRTQADASVTVKDLRGEGQVIPGSCVDVRVVRGLRGLPEFLEKRSTVSIPEGQTRTFWLTLHVPEGARPGFYRGTITVSAGGQPTDVEMLLRVPPLTLPPPAKGYGFWWAMDGRWKGYYSDERDTALEQIRKQFIMLREHGCNMVSCPIMPKMTRSADGTLDYDFGQEHWAHCRFSLDDFIRIGRETGLFSPECPIQYPGAESLHSDWIAREFHLDRDSAEFERFYRDACRRIDEWTKQRGFLLAFACVDEIGNGPDRQQEALRFYARASEAGVLTSVTDNSMHGGVHLMGQPRFDDIIAMRLYNFVTPEMLAHTADSGDHLWLYNVGSAGWSAKMDRFVFGLFTERCAAEGCAQWAFQWPSGEGGPYVAAQAGQSAGWHYALPAPDGPLPTLALEGVREGIDDGRYLALLKGAAPGSPEASLEDVEPLSPRIGEYLEAHDANSFDVRRWRMVRAAMAAQR